ncbi:hypothetical protein [Breoghania corrubedonensis]|uniref:hypothetical protein n=1 Tax=Breoghania corrubedonensis TaxID=665038 RepID=UPI000D36B21A|nr:hypothetical protein [Breoghania corrubedonensis]
MRPELVEGRILDDPDEVASFLTENNLTREGILAVRDAAYVQRIDCSPLMAVNAPGTFAYHYGVLEMRVQFLGQYWDISREGGIEAIINPQKNTKIVFQNVDVACSRLIDPKPRSEKGAGVERECQGNLFEFYGISTPKKIRAPKAGTAVHFIMVDDRGAVEVSRPVIEDKKFTGFIERVFVSDGADLDAQEVLPSGPLDQPVDDFDVQVRRRSE